jgi:NAD(P)-dependent dehydrogenase (short-subunit alcohol dehydrogenase family)
MGVLDRFRLDDKVAIVTGGSRGLGKEMANTLAQASASVVVVSRDELAVAAAAKEMQAASGSVCRGYGCDVSDAEHVQALVKRVIDEFGQIDVLINNAGINIRGPIEQLSLEQFQRVLDTNLIGPWLMCRAAASHMKARRYGRVINVGSTLSVVSMPERTPYASSKGALLQLTRTLALEWAPFGVTVNAILPGPFATEMNRMFMDDPAKYQAIVDQVPLRRWGELEEIGGLALFLASDASSFVTGAGIAIDGGWIAR